jgi:hypothetical protein
LLPFATLKKATLQQLYPEPVITATTGSYGVATNVSVNILHANRTFPSNFRIFFKIRIYRNSLILLAFVVYIAVRNSFSGCRTKAVACFVPQNGVGLKHDSTIYPFRQKIAGWKKNTVFFEQG